MSNSIPCSVMIISCKMSNKEKNNTNKIYRDCHYMWHIDKHKHCTSGNTVSKENTELRIWRIDNLSQNKNLFCRLWDGATQLSRFTDYSE